MLSIDDRVGSKELYTHVNCGIEKELTRLDYADVSFYGSGPEEGVPVSIGVERKTLTDLVNSISTGRLSGYQLRGLINKFDYVYLLIEGLWRTNQQNGLLEIYRGRGWQPLKFGSRNYMGREITGYLNTLFIMTGVGVWRSDNLGQSGRWLSDMYLWWQKPWERHKSHLQFHIEPSKNHVDLIPPNLVSRICKELTGVGWDKARALGDHFRDLHTLMAADEKVLMEIPGIGKKIARSIITELHG